jgi:hypothetical protein
MQARVGQHNLNPGKNGIPDPQVASRDGAVGKSTLIEPALTQSTQAQRPATSDAGASRSPLFADDAHWEPIDLDELEEAGPETEPEAAGGEEVEPENTEAISRLDAAPSEESVADGDDAGGDAAAPAARESGDSADASDAAEEQEATSTAMPSDALELGPDPSRAEADEDAAGDDADDDDDDDEAQPGAALRAAGDRNDDAEDAGGDPAAAAPAAAPAARAARAAAAAAPAARAAAAPRRARTAPQHRGKFERTVKNASGHDAKQDRYNRPSVRSNRVRSAIQINRPGLRVGNRDEFHLKGDYAYRYMITSGRKAEVADKIWERDLQRGNSKQGGRLALNPSAVRKLMINGVEVECIMSWSGGQSAAWIAIKDLRGASVGAIRAAAKRAEKLRPKNTTQGARDSAVEMKFRLLDDPIGTKDHIDEQRYVVPGQKSKGGNAVGDYLGKSVLRREREGTRGRAASQSKQIETANGGQPVDLENRKRATFNITMNLPKDRTPPVAIDVAHPGDSFFVPRGKTFRREISLYRRTKTSSKVRQTWVFGFIGRDEGARKVADEKRRGWVPLRVLA